MNKDEFEEKLNESLKVIWDINLFEYGLMFITAFLVSAVIFAVLGLTFYPAFVAAFIVTLVFYVLKDKGYDAVRYLERGNPDLEDKLMAAYDNRSTDNFVVRELVRDVSYDLNYISTDTFLNMKRVGIYVGVSMIAALLLLFIIISDYGSFGPGSFLGGAGGSGSGGGQGQGSGSGAGGGGTADEGEIESSQNIEESRGPPKDIYGDSSIAKIEGEDMELEMHPEYGEDGGFDSEGSEGGEGVKEIQQGFVQSTVAESYTENIPVEMEDTIRTYFEKIAED
jgi:hypothetical protein